VAKACPSAWSHTNAEPTFVVAYNNTSLTAPPFSARTSMSKLRPSPSAFGMLANRCMASGPISASTDKEGYGGVS